MAMSKGNKSKSYMGGHTSGNEMMSESMPMKRHMTQDKMKAAPVPANGGHKSDKMK